MNDNKKKDTLRPIRVGAMNFEWRRIAVLFALTMSSVTSQALAGDFVDTRFPPPAETSTANGNVPLADDFVDTWRSQQSLERLLALPLNTEFRGMPSNLAFAMPQSSQGPGGSTQSQKRATSKGKKWGGIALMIAGGALIARGATLSDPCDSFGPGFICTSNYKSVRVGSISIGAGVLGAGAWLFSRRNR